MAEKCSYCGEVGHSIQQCPKWKGKSSYIEERLPVREVETGRVTFIKPTAVREATWEEITLDTIFDAMNITYNTFVESPPRILHEENVLRFINFSRTLYDAQKRKGFDVEKFRKDFEEKLNYYLKFVEQIR